MRAGGGDSVSASRICVSSFGIANCIHFAIFAKFILFITWTLYILNFALHDVCMYACMFIDFAQRVKVRYIIYIKLDGINT